MTPPGRLRRTLRWLRHWPDRLRHAGRRRELTRRLGSGPAPRTLLFVCLGNICRSPFAEQVARRLASARDADLRISSAGFIGPGRPAPANARSAAAEAGYDLSRHVSQLIAEPVPAAEALVVVMEPGQAARVVRTLGIDPSRVIVLGDLDPEPITTRAIPDPYGRPVEEFRSCYARIERCVRALCDAVTGPRRPG